MAKSRLEELYSTKIRPELQSELQLNNIMEVPRLKKVVLNIGVKDADTKILQTVENGLKKIAGQNPVRTNAKKSIAGFKLREGTPIGVMVTLRGTRAYEFLDRFINIALPKTRDFQGLPSKFDGKGNLNTGIKEWIIFPEIDYDTSDKLYGMNITIVTSSENDAHARALLHHFGMPFRKS